MTPVLDKDQVRQVIARRVARELRDGDFVNLGIGIPTYVPEHLPEGVQVVLESENGIVRSGPCECDDDADPFVVNAGGRPASCLVGGAFIDSVTSFALIRGGHVDATVLGALQVDAAGNLASWVVPGRKMLGMGGAMDLGVGARRVIVAMEHTQGGEPKVRSRCTLPLTAQGCVDLVVTEMGVMAVRDGELHLQEVNPAFTVAEVRAATEARLVVADPLPSMI